MTTIVVPAEWCALSAALMEQYGVVNDPLPELEQDELELLT
jgi:hypothetical protein